MADAREYGQERNISQYLNLENDFERIVYEMVNLQRRKAADYASKDDTLKNMRFVVDVLGIESYTVVEDCNAMVIRKCARINNLRGREAVNEGVRDSYVDRACYAILALVALDEETKEQLQAYGDQGVQQNGSVSA